MVLGHPDQTPDLGHHVGAQAGAGQAVSAHCAERPAPGRPSYTPSWNQAASRTVRVEPLAGRLQLVEAVQHLTEVLGVVVPPARVGVRREQRVADVLGAGEGPPVDEVHAASSSGSASVCSTTREVTARVRHM